MAKYKVVESMPSTTVWTYTVEAENETEAVEKVAMGRFEDMDISYGYDYGLDPVIDDVEKIEE